MCILLAVGKHKTFTILILAGGSSQLSVVAVCVFTFGSDPVMLLLIQLLRFQIAECKYQTSVARNAS